MKKLFLIITLFFIPISANGLIITEVQVSGESTSNCYIKIFNPTDQDILLDGYKIRKMSSTGKDYSIRAIPKGTLIKSQDYITWANSRDGFNKKINAQIYSTATISKDNSIAILSPSGEIIDALAWGAGENQYVLGAAVPNNPNKNQLIKRHYNDGYQNTKNNSKDFYLYPETRTEIKLNTSTTINIAETEKKEPNKTKAVVSLFSAFLALILKKSIY